MSKVISEVPLTTHVSKDVKMPVSDGTGEARTISLDQVCTFVKGAGGGGAGMTEEEKQNLNDLMDEVFPLTASWASNNAGTREVGTKVVPTGTAKIERKGTDVSSSATLTVAGATVSGKTFTGTEISSGSKSYSGSVTQGGQTKSLGSLTWSFTYYRYRGAVSSVPTDYPTAIKALATKELSTSSTLGSTTLAANMYYLFAVKGSATLVCRHASTDGVIGGCVTGTCTVSQENDATKTNTYSYILVPASASQWSFKITNS